MKQSGYRTVLHIYLIFFLSLLGTLLLAGWLFFLTVSVRTPDGTRARSDWPKTFTEDFRDQVVFIDGLPQIKQAGMELLQENAAGIQILDGSGREVYSYQKPDQAPGVYSNAELLRPIRSGHAGDGDRTAFGGILSNDGKEYVYILYFPVDVAKITMYVNGERFAGGKAVVLPVLLALLAIILVLGILYGILTSRAFKRLTEAVHEISDRRYLPIQNPGVFRDLYGSLNALDAEIRAGDSLRAQTDAMRREWIANITHDLKTPLSPIKGYAEMLGEDGGVTPEQCRRYAGITLKNVSYLETLIDDLKLTYQLEQFSK